MEKRAPKSLAELNRSGLNCHSPGWPSTSSSRRHMQKSRYNTAFSEEVHSILAHVLGHGRQKVNRTV